MKILVLYALFASIAVVRGMNFSPPDITQIVNQSNTAYFFASTSYQYIDITFTINSTLLNNTAIVRITGKYTDFTFYLHNGTTHYQISTECGIDGQGNYNIELQAYTDLSVRFQGDVKSALLSPGTQVSIPNPIDGQSFNFFIHVPEDDMGIGYYLDVLNPLFVPTGSIIATSLGDTIFCNARPMKRSFEMPKVDGKKPRQIVSDQCALRTPSAPLYSSSYYDSNFLSGENVRIQTFQHIQDGNYSFQIDNLLYRPGAVNTGYNVTFFSIENGGCPNDCSNKGNCLKGVCKCSSRFFSGPDCSTIQAELINETYVEKQYNSTTERLFYFMPYNVTADKRDLDGNLYFSLSYPSQAARKKKQLGFSPQARFYNKDFELLAEVTDGRFEMSAAEGDQKIYLHMVPDDILDQVDINWSVGDYNRVLSDSITESANAESGPYQIFTIPGPITNNLTVSLLGSGTLTVWPRRWTNRIDFSASNGPLATGQSYDVQMGYDLGHVSLKIDPSNDFYQTNLDNDLYAYVSEVAVSDYTVTYEIDKCGKCVSDCIEGVCKCKPGFTGQYCDTPINGAIVLQDNQTTFANFTNKLYNATAFKFTSNNHFFIAKATYGYGDNVYTNYSNNPTFLSTNPGYCPGDTVVLQYEAHTPEQCLYLTPHISPVITYNEPMTLDFPIRQTWSASRPEEYYLYKFDITTEDNELLNITLSNGDGLPIDIYLYENHHDCTYEKEIQWDYLYDFIPEVVNLRSSVKNAKKQFGSPTYIERVIARGHPIDATLVLFSSWDPRNVTFTVTKTVDARLECPNKCSRIGYCNVYTGQCECPVGYQSRNDCSIPTCTNFDEVPNQCNLVGSVAPSPFLANYLPEAYFFAPSLDQGYEPFGESTLNCSIQDVYQYTLLGYNQTTHFVTDWLNNFNYDADRIVPYFSSECLSHFRDLLCNTLFVPCIGDQIVLPANDLYKNVVLNCPVLLQGKESISFDNNFGFTSYDRTKLNYTRPGAITPITTSAPGFLTTGARNLRTFDTTQTITIYFNDTTNSSCTICASDTYSCTLRAKSGSVSARIPPLDKDGYKVSGIYFNHMESVTCSQTKDSSTNVVAQVSETKDSNFLKILDYLGSVSKQQCCSQCDNNENSGENFATWAYDNSPKILTISSDSDPSEVTLCVQSATITVGYEKVNTPPAANVQSEPKRLKAGAIAGIVIGVVLGVLLIVVIVFVVILLYRRKQKEQKEASGVEMTNQEDTPKPTNTIYEAVVHHDEDA